MSREKTHFRTCTLCEAMCGIAITYQGNEILSIKGDKEDPFSRGHICPKAIALKDIHEDPDRLRLPMERTRDGWREISWSEALDKTAKGIQSVQRKYGKDAFASYMGNPNVHNMGAMLMSQGFLRTLNTRNKFSATSVDQLPHHIVAYHLFGHQLKVPVPDIDSTNHFLMLGANPVASNGSMMSVPDVKKRLQAITKSGGKLIVVDPRFTETAEIATEHHFVRPGSDVLLLLAMMNTLFGKQLIQPGKLSRWISNYKQELENIERAVLPYTPERVVGLTGLSAEKIRNIVVEFCSASKPVLYGRMGVSVQRYGLLSQYLIMLFNILTGRLDQRGGLLFTKPAADLIGHTGPGNVGRNRTRVRGLPSFNGEFPVAALAEEILTEGGSESSAGSNSAIRGLVCIAGNPVLSTPNGRQMDKAFEKLEFMVSIDFYINESNRHANIILPPVSPLEREHYDVIFHLLAIRNTAKYSPALFQPDAAAKQDWQILMALEQRLSTTKKPKDRLIQALKNRLGPKALVNLLLMTGPYNGLNPFQRLTVGKLEKAPHGLDLGPLQPSLPKGLVHKDKKIHLNTGFYFADLARLERQFIEERDNRKFSMQLIGRRHIRSNNSWLHNSHRLVKGKSRCTAIIHSSDAKRLGVESGARLRVTSRVGSVVIASEVSDSIMPGVISIPHGWGHLREGPRIRQRIASSFPGVSVNDLTDELLVDELSGNAVLNGVQVDVEALSDVKNNLPDSIGTEVEMTQPMESGICNEEALVK